MKANPVSNISTLRRKPNTDGKNEPKILENLNAANDESLRQQAQEKIKLPDMAANDEDNINSEILLNDEKKLKESTEHTEQLKNSNDLSAKQVDSLQAISSKLDVLTDKLRLKTEASKADEAVTTSDVLTEKSNPELVKPDKPAEPKLPVADEPKPSADLLDKKDVASQAVEGAPVKANPALMALNVIGGTIKAGFKKVISGADRMFSMVFKFSLSQAAQAAKVAAAIGAIVLGIDIMKAVWQKWGADILAAFESFSNVVSEWWNGFTEFMSTFSDLKTAFESMSGSFMAIKNAWETGDWPALAGAIGKSIVNGLKTLEGVLGRVITSLLSKLLNVLGFKDAAKSVEAEGLQRYQNLTNNRLSDENQKKLAEEQLKREKKDGKTPTQRGVTSFLPDTWRKKIGFISGDEYDQIQAEKKDQYARKGLSHEDQVANVAAANEAREAVARFRDVAENVNPNNASQVAKFDKYKKEAQEYVNNAALSKTPTIKAELQNQINSISKLVSPKAAVKPNKSSESRDAQTARNINKAEAAKKSNSSAASNTTNNVNSTVVKSNKSVNVHAPVTSTRAPGVFGATGVN